jgi:hypothetical protein
VEKPGGKGQATHDYMAHAYCILNNQGYKYITEYVILSAFLLQQWLQERASALRYMYCACLVKIDSWKNSC